MSAAGRYWLNASQDPRQPEGGEGRPAAGSSDSHRAYHNDFLDDTFCTECGAYWPCVPARDAMTCKCSHVATVHARGVGECWSAACGCRTFRLRVTA